MPSHFTAVLDACVLYPAFTRNVLLQLATTGLYRAKWTAEIDQEWRYHLTADKPDIATEKLNSLTDLMHATVPDWEVTGYDGLIAGLEFPDQDDRHVLAAAIRCNAAVIVTLNLKDFPANTLAPYGLETQTPDEFMEYLLDLDAELVASSCQQIRARLKKPFFSQEQFIDHMKTQGLAQSATRLESAGLPF